MASIRIKKMIEQVRIEAKNLRKNATKQEISRLFISRLRPKERAKCIYGQMTGDCFSTRANVLIVECCPRVYDAKGKTDLGEGRLNGRPSLVAGIERGMEYFSAIETFVIQNLSNQDELNAELISYLRGERDRLVLKVK